ncbi:MAG: bifunctional DNA primase/polymerase [Methylocystis sp.]|uniref:bifunctional DNA primase/polymerase n=1 Tax=Methylocystis sp. TaxID=1911079 RepID=UPI003DA4444E
MGEAQHFSSLNSAIKMDAALFYASLGFHVFPLHFMRADGCCSCGKPDCANAAKHPLTRYGQNDASTNVSRIRYWWTRWPSANIGLHCKRSGLVVIDIDPRNGGDVTFTALESAHGDIASPLTSNTGGGGKHILFAAPDYVARIPGALGDGVDVKHNGYIILPPSNHKSGGHYQWADGARFTALPVLPEWVATPIVVERKERLSTDNMEFEFAELCEAVLSLPSYSYDNYHEWVHNGMSIYHASDGSDDGYDLFDAFSQQSEKYNGPLETIRKWESFGDFHNNPRTANSIYKVARQYGWKPWDETPEPWSIADFENTDAQTVLCAASLAVESAPIGDRITLRRYCKLVAWEVALENLDEQTARQVIGDAASSIGIGRDEFRLIFDGALRWQRKELAIRRFLEEDECSRISLNKKEREYLERRS